MIEFSIDGLKMVTLHLARTSPPRGFRGSAGFSRLLSAGLARLRQDPDRSLNAVIPARPLATVWKSRCREKSPCGTRDFIAGVNGTLNLTRV